MAEKKAPAAPSADVTRREFMATTLAAGFALAVQPVSADTITTNANDLVAGDLSIPLPGGQISAYQAMPASGKAHPLVLVVHEIFGVHEHIKDVCRRFAKLGYFAVAPALYSREGDVSGMTDIGEIISKVVSKVPDAQVASDLDATVAWAKSTGKADVARLGVTGFCWGGRQTWLYAIHNPSVRAAVAWYGPLGGKPDPLHPKTVLEQANEVKAPVLGLYGGADQGIPVADIEKMRDELMAAKKPCEIVIYPDTPHGFNADYRPSYREKQAKDAWKKMLAWFRKHGVA